MAKTATQTNRKQRTSTKSMKKAAGTRKTRPASKARTAVHAAAAGGEEVTIDRRRGERRGADQEAAEAAPGTSDPKIERRQKVNRRRQIDPTTCERDYTDQEVEFMNALDDYKRKSGRMFPTCSEVLEVIRSLGYVKLSPSEMLAVPGATQSCGSAKPMPADWSSSVGSQPPAELSADELF